MGNVDFIGCPYRAKGNKSSAKWQSRGRAASASIGGMEAFRKPRPRAVPQGQGRRSMRLPGRIASTLSRNEDILGADNADAASRPRRCDGCDRRILRASSYRAN